LEVVVVRHTLGGCHICGEIGTNQIKPSSNLAGSDLAPAVKGRDGFCLYHLSMLGRCSLLYCRNWNTSLWRGLTSLQRKDGNATTQWGNTPFFEYYQTNTQLLNVAGLASRSARNFTSHPVTYNHWRIHPLYPLRNHAYLHQCAALEISWRAMYRF
jgi:hypothetical protein